jgi:hypothetical protein
MTRLRVRWATGPDDVPGPGEAVARLAAVEGSYTTERYAAAGRLAPGLAYDRATGELVPTAPRPTDLVVGRHRMVMTVTAAGRQPLVARFGLDADSPQIDADAPADLRDALNRAWAERPPRGRAPGTTVEDAGGDETIRALVADLRRNGRRVTLKSIAATSGTFTRDNLRYYLRVNKRRISDYQRPRKPHGNIAP